MRIAMERYEDAGQPLWPVVPSSLYGAFLAGEATEACILVITFDASLARAGGAVRRSETFISISDRQLPPGHDPGADYGEAPHGRQRGSRPCNILVESRGYLMPRRDERPR